MPADASISSAVPPVGFIDRARERLSLPQLLFPEVASELERREA